MVLDMTELECLRCRYKWYPRHPKPPLVCPACKSRKWMQARGKKKRAVAHA